MLYVGIDPGVTTGFAVWDGAAKRMLAVDSMAVHVAMREVEGLHRGGKLALVVFEDARLRKWFAAADRRQSASGAGVREGVGSVKRDCGIWTDFLTDLGVKFLAVAPQRGATKWSPAHLAKLTGWTARTNNHGRDAAALVVGR